MQKMQARNLSDLVRTSMLIDLSRESTLAGSEPTADADSSRGR
jgi:hypothetical protein